MYLPKRSVFEGYICFIFLAFVLSFGVTMLSCMAGNESEAIKKSGIWGETKLFLGKMEVIRNGIPIFLWIFSPLIPHFPHFLFLTRK